MLQVAVHLWATEGESLSSCSFKILYDVASLFGSDIYNACLKNMYKSYISCCKVTELVNSNHKQSLRDSFVQFFSIDLQKSVDLALVSTQRLAKIFELGIKLKREVCAGIYKYYLVMGNLRVLTGVIYFPAFMAGCFNKDL